MSAERISSTARTVSKPGSPGPVPTKLTCPGRLAALAERAVELAVRVEAVLVTASFFVGVGRVVVLVFFVRVDVLAGGVMRAPPGQRR